MEPHNYEEIRRNGRVASIRGSARLGRSYSDGDVRYTFVVRRFLGRDAPGFSLIYGFKLSEGAFLTQCIGLNRCLTFCAS